MNIRAKYLNCFLFALNEKKFIQHFDVVGLLPLLFNKGEREELVVSAILYSSSFII